MTPYRVARAQTEADRAADLRSWKNFGVPDHLRDGHFCKALVAGRQCEHKARLPQHWPLYCTVHHRIYEELALVER